LQFLKCVERPEEIPRDAAVVPEPGVPALRRRDQKAHTDGIVQVEVFGTVFDVLPRESALRCGTDFQHAGLDTARAEAAPVRLRQAGDERLFDGAQRLERFAKAAKDFLVLVAVLLFEHNKSRGGKAVFEAVEAAALFAGVGFRSALPAVASVCRALSF
jgi:hypothetical protein